MRYIINDDDLEDWAARLQKGIEHINNTKDPTELVNASEYIVEEMQAYINEKNYKQGK